MVQNIFDLGEREDRILNIIKAKFGLKNKSEALALIVQSYEDNFLEPELRPEYVEKLDKLSKQKGIPFKNAEELRRHIENA